MNIPIPPIGENEIHSPGKLIHEQWLYRLNYIQFYNLGDGLTFIPPSNLSGEN